MIRKGRFNKPAAEIAQRYGESVSFDWRLYRQDIAGSIAHAAALARAGISSAAELRWRHTRRLATGAPSRDNTRAQIQRWRSDLGLTDESV